MNISELTDEQKSVALARLCDWFVEKLDNTTDFQVWVLVDKNLMIARLGQPHFLYDPAHMALAWRVLNWAYNGLSLHTWGARSEFDYALARQKLAKIFELYPRSITGFGLTYHVVYEMPPADAQRLWLDTILELAIEAGLVSEEAA